MVWPTVMMLLNLVIFLRVAMRYVYKTVPRKREAPLHNRPRWYEAQEQSNPTNFPVSIPPPLPEYAPYGLASWSELSNLRVEATRFMIRVL